MADLPEYKIEVYSNKDKLPADAENLFAAELAESRQPLPAERADRDQWKFVCVCAVTKNGGVLGGGYMDIGPVNFGPLANDKLAYLEHLLTRPEYRRRGVGAEILRKMIQVAKAGGCQYIRCNASWNNLAEIGLFKKCGFALADISEEGGRYFTVKPLQGYGCNI